MTSDILSRLAAAERESVQTAAGSDIFAAARREELEAAIRDRDLWRERHDRERAAHAKNLEEQRKVEAERDGLRTKLELREIGLRLIAGGPPITMSNDCVAVWAAFVAQEALGEDTKPMPSGARRSQCPACGWTFGTHAPDCESERLRKFT